MATARGRVASQTKADLQAQAAGHPSTVPPAGDPVDPQKLAEDIRQAWLACRQAVATCDKSIIRQLHIAAKQWDREMHYAKVLADFHRLRRYFPSAVRLEPERIDPILVPVRPNSLEERLFRIARGYWSMPYSKGYGRRLRFLVLDRYHEAVVGIIGLQSPSADLACRDSYLGVPREKKLGVINNTLDAFTVGATPTYAPLLAGKLIAGLLHSPIIRQEYWRAYGGKRTTQLKKRIPQPLLAITTASAFGRSSVYNRLRFKDRVLAESLGYTKGFGTLHLEGMYPRMVEWLKASGRHVPAGFGNGPKVRWQNIIRTLLDLEISTDYLEHGIRREVFIFELVHNLVDVCRSNATPDVATFDDGTWADFWKERWCLPRVSRDQTWYEFDGQAMFKRALDPY